MTNFTSLSKISRCPPINRTHISSKNVYPPIAGQGTPRTSRDPSGRSGRDITNNGIMRQTFYTPNHCHRSVRIGRTQYFSISKFSYRQQRIWTPRINVLADRVVRCCFFFFIEISCVWFSRESRWESRTVVLHPTRYRRAPGNSI